MNTKSFAIGFAAMNSIIAGVSTTKRSIVDAAKSSVHGAQVSVQAAKTGVRNTPEVVTSFFAGAKQAIKYRRGMCPKLTVDVHSSEERCHMNIESN